MSKLNIKDNADIFKCPVCSGNMDVVDLRSLICFNGHNFDISRSGYVNFLTKPVKTEYDKALFHSRSLISRHGFFGPLIEAIVELIAGKEPADAGTHRRMVLDAGCGEGSHLDQIIGELDARARHEYVGVGMDISKEGIQIASRQYPNRIWCVGDLTHIPFNDGSFDVILNILSPSNYKEFSRLLAVTGILIKVIPGRDYLKEIREAFFDKTEKQTYSNERVYSHFCKNFEFIGSRDVRYTTMLDEEMLRHLIKMTPLSWTATDLETEHAIASLKGGITADFTVLYGGKGN